MRFPYSCSTCDGSVCVRQQSRITIFLELSSGILVFKNTFKRDNW